MGFRFDPCPSGVGRVSNRGFVEPGLTSLYDARLAVVLPDGRRFLMPKGKSKPFSFDEHRYDFRFGARRGFGITTVCG